MAGDDDVLKWICVRSFELIHFLLYERILTNFQILSTIFLCTSDRKRITERITSWSGL